MKDISRVKIEIFQQNTAGERGRMRERRVEFASSFRNMRFLEAPSMVRRKRGSGRTRGREPAGWNFRSG
jgi:hypothetical protein